MVLIFKQQLRNSTLTLLARAGSVTDISYWTFAFCFVIYDETFKFWRRAWVVPSTRIYTMMIYASLVQWADRVIGALDGIASHVWVAN